MKKSCGKLSYKQILSLVEGVGLVGEDVCTDVGMDEFNKRPIPERVKELYDLFIKIWHISHWALSPCCKSPEHDKQIYDWYKQLVKDGYVRKPKSGKRK